MKRIRIFLALLVCLCLLGIPAAAASTATSIVSNATLQIDGSCLVHLTIGLHLDSATQTLTFPIPVDAEEVTLNGASAQTQLAGPKQQVLLQTLAAGDHTLIIAYKLPNAADAKTGLLTLPLLSGFAYPVEAMEFSVTLPGALTGKPRFESGYHQHLIEDQIVTVSSENALHGYLKSGLKDHETLVLTLPINPEMIQPVQTQRSWLSSWDWALLICFALCILYYCITLLPRFPGKERCFSAPEGIAAGQVGTCLVGCGTDLTLMVLGWSQLGYIRLEKDRHGRLILHKQMEMGNERSGLEQRIFKGLFGGRPHIDATGYHYAQLYRKLSAKSALARQMYLPRSGNPLIFRFLCCATAAVSGISMAMQSDGSTGTRVVLTLLFVLLYSALSYGIQSGGKSLLLWDKTPIWIALICSGIWICLGVFQGRLWESIGMVVFQLVAGIAAAWGGKRSELGALSMRQILGLRRHMIKAKTFDLQQLLQNNPNYYYELAPYALALGVDKVFARRFGKTVLPESDDPYFGRSGEMTAAQWASQLRQTAQELNKRQKYLPYEQFTRK